jgi:hypothetical protein
LRGLARPLFVEGDHLVVRGRDGSLTRLQLTGDGAVTALLPYRYSTATNSGERGQGTRTWSRVGNRRRGQPPPGFGTFNQPLNPLSAEVGGFTGKWWQRTFSFEVEWGIAALDRNGNVLLRMRPLRSLGQVRRFAQACGLAFIESR